MKPLIPHHVVQWVRWASGAAAICACTASLSAAPLEPEERASASVSGVHMTVVADAWTGMPPDLGDVQPLLVSIDNQSDVPLRISYDQFVAVGPGGDRQPAVPPLEIRETVWVDPYYFPGSYPVARGPYYYGGYYPRYRSYGGWYGWDPWYYPTPSVRVGLPTQDMLMQALPDGVVEPGERMTGFLYLADKPRKGKHSTFVANLVNARTNQPFARIEVPIEID